MGSTPTSASFISVAAYFLLAAAIVSGVSSPARAQFLPPIPGLTPPPPVPGSAPPQNYVGDRPGMSSSGGTKSGETVRQFTEEEMNGHFDGRVADNYFESPECSWEDRICYGYLSADALYWDRVRSASSTVALNSATGAVIFSGRNFIWNDLEVLPRLTGGYVMDNGLAVEGSFFYKDDLDTHAGFGLPGNISMNAFGTPSAAFAPNFFQADSIGVGSAVQIQSGEVHVMQTNNFFNFLAGFRWFELNDRTRIDTFKAGVLSGVDIQTFNTMLGGQVGVKVRRQRGVYSFDAFGKAGFYVNTGKSNTAVFNAGAGLPDQTIFSRGNSEAFAAEAQMMLTYNPYIWLHVRVGYQGLIIQQIALATDQVRDNSGTGSSLFERSDIIYHGPFAGLEFRW